jgi:UDP-2-acetamido-3-amino-2,3-dideoxy-glucuronate N-acetyltransferase
VKDITVGRNTRIYDQVNLYKCKIGEGSKIDAFVYVEDGVTIGNRVKIRAFSFIPSGVTIEDDVFIGPSVTFTNDKYPKIGRQWELLRTVVHNGASIGGGSVILPGITIGKNSLIGAGSVVTKSVPANSIAFGNPARIKKRNPQMTAPIKDSKYVPS